NASGITNGDCFVTHGGDGFYTRIDPKDSNIVYATMQNGGLVRFDRRTGERVGIQPQPAKGDTPMRWNWDAPLAISPHLNTRLYFARSGCIAATIVAIAGAPSARTSRANSIATSCP